MTFSVKNGSATVPDEFGSIAAISGINIDAKIERDEVGSSATVGNENQQGTTVRPGGEEWPDDPLTPDDPTPPTPPVDDDDDVISISSDTFNMDIVNDAVEGGEYVVEINCQNGIQNLFVEIKSDYLTEEFLHSVGMTAKFDLANPGSYEKALVGFKLPVGSDVVGKTYVDFNLTELIPLLSLDPDLGQHTFILTVVDAKGNEKSKTLVFQSVEE